MAFFHNRRLSSESSSICGPWCFITAGILKNLIPLSLFARLLQFITIQETGILDKIVGNSSTKTAVTLYTKNVFTSWFGVSRLRYQFYQIINKIF